MGMKVLIQRRAEIALRSLDPPERRKVEEALRWLESTDPSALNASPKLQKLKLASPRLLYSLRVGNRLRVILSFNPTEWTVEDIVDHDRLVRLIRDGEAS